MPGVYYWFGARHRQHLTSLLTSLPDGGPPVTVALFTFIPPVLLLFQRYRYSCKLLRRFSYHYSLLVTLPPVTAHILLRLPLPAGMYAATSQYAFAVFNLYRLNL